MWLDIYSWGKHYMLNIGQEVQRLAMCEECNDCIPNMSVKWLNEIWPHKLTNNYKTYLKCWDISKNTLLCFTLKSFSQFVKM